MTDHIVPTALFSAALGLSRNAFFEHRRHAKCFPSAVKGAGAGRYRAADVIHYAQNHWVDKAAEYQALANDATQRAGNMLDFITAELQSSAKEAR